MHQLLGVGNIIECSKSHLRAILPMWAPGRQEDARFLDECVNSEFPDSNDRYTLCHTNTTFQSQVKTYQEIYNTQGWEIQSYIWNAIDLDGSHSCSLASSPLRAILERINSLNYTR